MLRTALLLPLGFLALASCGGKNAGETVRPNDPTFAAARGGGPATCHEVDAESTPLVVDWNPEERGDLEAAMKEGVAIFHYDCKTVKLLPDCKVEGAYGFVGTTKREQVISIENADQAQANLPLHGASISAGMERGASIDIGLIMVGKSATKIPGIQRASLGPKCEGATHYVQSATMGAFAMRTSTSGAVHAKAAIDVFGASGQSTSSKDVVNKDGEVDACKSSDVDATKATNGCGAPIRIRLLAISGDKIEDRSPPKSDVVCPKGLVIVAGKCVAVAEAQAATTAAYACTDDDTPAVCEAQCTKGSAESCSSAALYYDAGDHGVTQDRKKAKELASKACDLNDYDSCDWIAGNMNDDIPKAREIFQRSCDAGHTWSCQGLGAFWSKGEGADLAKGLRAYQRGCAGGEEATCTSAADRLAEGGGNVTADIPQAIAIYTNVCKSRPKDPAPWTTESCYKAAVLIGKKDAATSKAFMKRACAEKYDDSCKRLKKMK